VTHDPAPLIVSALFGPEDFAWLDGLRRTHFPPERNQLAAHLTLFHHLPPSLEPELRQRLIGATRHVAAPAASVAGLMKLGRGVALRIDAPGLQEIRHDLADAFAGLLTPQDAGGWRPHVTIQNKVEPAEARRLHDQLAVGFRPRPLRIAGIGVWRYRGGPWEPVSRHPFG
jgi:hypothetical protein